MSCTTHFCKFRADFSLPVSQTLQGCNEVDPALGQLIWAASIEFYFSIGAAVRTILGIYDNIITRVQWGS